MNKVLDYLKKLSNQKLTLSSRAGIPTIKTTQRSLIKKDIESAFVDFLRENLNDNETITIVEKTSEGVIMALEHKDLTNNNNVAGEICFELNIKVKNLDYDIMNEKVNYEFEQEQKRLKAIEKAENKKRKIQRDRIAREQKKLLEEKRKATE